MSFRELELIDPILDALDGAGYREPTPVQAACIPKVLKGKDVTGIAQTGTGKTAAFVVPIVQRLAEAHNPEAKGKAKIKCLILTPTRELAEQIRRSVVTYGGRLRVKAVAIYGGVEEAVQIKRLKRGVEIIVATPGRLLALRDELNLDFSHLTTLILDEADRMLHMGFLPQVEKLVSPLPKRRQTLMFSATMPRGVESLAKRFQYHPEKVQIGKASNPADTVQQCIYEVPSHLKGPLLIELLKQGRWQRVLVFVKMRDHVNRLTETLREGGIRVTRLHSERSQLKREKALQDFKDGKYQVLVATDVIARGIDIEGVSHVVNFDFPVNPEDYIHRIGRTGRAEASGEAISFVPEKDENLLRHLELTIGKTLPRRKLKGFNYRAPIPRRQAGQPAPKKDWRKRTREREGQGKTQGGRAQSKRGRRSD